MLSDLGYNVLAGDLDPQADLTAAFLVEEQLEALWGDDSTPESPAGTILNVLNH